MAAAATNSPATMPRTRARSAGTIVPSTSSVKQRLREWIAARQPAAITEAVWHELQAPRAPVSESSLRALLRATGLPFDQPWAGVRQHTFDELEQSLREMLEVYRAAAAAGDRDRSEEHTSELQSRFGISYAVFCL